MIKAQYPQKLNELEFWITKYLILFLSLDGILTTEKYENMLWDEIGNIDYR